MTRNIALKSPSGAATDAATDPTRDMVQGWGGLGRRSVVLVGLMGAGKTSIGRRVAARLGLPFRDADAEIEQAAGRTVPELFARFGEAEFRQGERRVIRRLLSGDPIVLATGGGAFMDPDTRAVVRARGVSIWLRASLSTLTRRVAGREHRPLLNAGDPETILRNLMAVRHPIYAEADVVVDCGDESPEFTTSRVIDALAAYRPPRRLPVALARGGYDVVVGEGLIERAGALLAPVLPQKRAIVVTDTNVAELHLQPLLAALEQCAIVATPIVVAAGEASKSLDSYADVTDRMLAAGVERRTAVIALGGGVVGDLAGYAAATVLRGLPFVQVPTTLLAQVDSSVGGKTGINTRHGKNLLGAFHQPLAVLADTTALGTLPPRELRAGYAETVKAGLIGDAAFFDWCETNGAAVIAGDAEARAEAILRACAFKAAVVGDDEREEKPNDGRALLNLGHTFAHALEAEFGYGDFLLHGEAVAVGIGLAFRLSARLGLCAEDEAERVVRHIDSVGLPAELRALNRRLSAARLMSHFRRDKKMRDGVLRFVLVRGIGAAFTSGDVPGEAVRDLLAAEGCAP
jgi:shikimate kinase/3-dehydroquinate synthase